MCNLLQIIVAVTVVTSVSSGSAVHESNSAFSCCDLTVNYLHDLSCENIWNSSEMNIAIFFGNTKSCKSPCKEIAHDRLILDRCVNVTVATVCAAKGVIKETWMSFHGQTCRLGFISGKPTGNRSSVVLLLLAFVAGRLLRFIS
ncbi:uncharacterized protein FYW61_006197 [Anableps anableps]